MFPARRDSTDEKAGLARTIRAGSTVGRRESGEVVDDDLAWNGGEWAYYA